MLTSKPRKAAEMSAEYKLDYKKAKPNRFANRLKAGPLIVVLDPDVAKIFTSAEEVKKALRAIISAMPKRPVRSPKVTLWTLPPNEDHIYPQGATQGEATL